MKKKNLQSIYIFLGIAIIILIPCILKNPEVKSLLVKWLSFSNNPDYIILYIQFIGSTIGTIISIYSALWINSKQQKKKDEKEQKECVKYLYTELNCCFEELKTIFRETKLTYNINTIGPEDIEKICTIANSRHLCINDEWVGKLAKLDDVLPAILKRDIKKYYGKLNVIKDVIESKEMDQRIYVSYICYFIANNGETLHYDVECNMNNLKSTFTINQ